MRGGSSSSPGGAEGLQHRHPPPEGAALLTERLSTGCPALTAAVFKQHGAEAEGPRWGEGTTANLGSLSTQPLWSYGDKRTRRRDWDSVLHGRCRVSPEPGSQCLELQRRFCGDRLRSVLTTILKTGITLFPGEKTGCPDVWPASSHASISQ